MPRKGHVRIREIEPDPRFGEIDIAKFIAAIMIDGKKSIAEKIMYGALDLAAKRVSMEPLEVFNKAMENVRPVVEVRPRRVGGATYQVPVEVQPRRAQALATRWILQYARGRKGIPMVERLARELTDACRG
ncbi:MAG: 30S ribosomal protein S7, partial [Thermovirgaceae bacterium]